MDALIDGFTFSKWHGDRLLMQVDSDRLDECVDYCNEYRIKLLHISPYHGYKLDDVDFLSRCPGVEGIHMQRGFSNYDGLYQLPRLKALSVVFGHNIDVAAIPSLQDLSTDWSAQVDPFIFSATNLQTLWLRSYKPKTGDFERLKSLSKLIELKVIQSPIRSIQGIEMLSRLKKIRISYCSKLKDIKPLLSCKRNLEELELDHCKKIEDLTLIRDLYQIKKIILTETGSLPSLHFIRQMKELRFLSFVGTTVLDGDMTPCFELEYAGFLRKRNYSHSFKQVEAEIEKRKNSGRLS